MTVSYKEHQPYCRFCNQTLDPTDKRVWCRVVGWEKNRGANEGVRPLKDRDFTGDYAHGHCLDIAAKGGFQESLLA